MGQLRCVGKARDVSQSGCRDFGAAFQTPEHESSGFCCGNGNGYLRDEIIGIGREMIEGTFEFQVITNGDAEGELQADIFS